MTDWKSVDLDSLSWQGMTQTLYAHPFNLGRRIRSMFSKQTFNTAAAYSILETYFVSPNPLLTLFINFTIRASSRLYHPNDSFITLAFFEELMFNY